MNLQSTMLVTNIFCWADVNPGWGKSAVNQSLQVKAKRKQKFEELLMNNIKAKMSFNRSDDRNDALVVGNQVDQVALLNFHFKFLQDITATHPKNIQWAL